MLEKTFDDSADTAKRTNKPILKEISDTLRLSTIAISKVTEFFALSRKQGEMERTMMIRKINGKRPTRRTSTIWIDIREMDMSVRRRG